MWGCPRSHGERPFFFALIQVRIMKGIERRLFVRCSGRIPRFIFFWPRSHLVNLEVRPAARGFYFASLRRW